MKRRIGTCRVLASFLRMRAVGASPAAECCPWHFLALTHHPSPTSTPPHWLNDSLSTFPWLPVWQGPGHLGLLGVGMDLREKWLQV